MELLQKIPGLSRKTVEDLIAEIGVDMEPFQPKSTWLRGPVSVLAITRAQVKKSGRTTHGNKQLKVVITEAAGSHPYQEHLVARYHRLAARRGKRGL